MPSGRSYVRSKLVFRNAQAGLFEGDPRERVSSDSLPGWLLQTIDRLDLSSVLALFEDHGGVAYDPRSMLGILLLGGLTGRTSSRDLEESCLYDVRFIYVSGSQTPDYRTIARFRSRIAPVMDDLFAQIVRLGMEDGHVRLGRVSLDSTKVSSAASAFRRQTRKELAEEGEESSDPDAVRLMGAGKRPKLGYTVQAAVDCETDLVLAVDVTRDKNDRNAAPTMLKKLEEITSFRPTEMLCDTGYDSHSTHHVLREAGVTAYIPAQDSDSGFWTVLNEDVLCPMGHPALPLKPKSEHGRLVQAFRVRACSSCSFKESCCPTQRGREVQVPLGADPKARILSMRRTASLEGKLAMRERSKTIEPVFGDMKWNHGLERLRHRSLTKAKAEVLTFFACRNLKKIYKACKGLLFFIIQEQKTMKTQFLPICSQLVAA